MPFDPSKPFDETEKTTFDPSKPFDEVETAPSKLESYGRGAIQTGTFGFADEIEAKARTILDAENYNPVRDAIRQKYKRAQAANPNPYLAGELTGGVVSTLIPYVGQLGRGATVGARIGGAAAQGAAGGLGSSEAEDTSGQASDTFWGGLTGGVFGIGADVISKIPGRVRNFAADRAAGQLGAERQTIKSIGAPRVREAGRIALDKNIIDPSTEVMQSRMKDLAKESGEKIGSIYSTIDESVPMSYSPKEVSAEFAKEHGGFYASPLNKDISNLYDNIIETVSAGGAETVPLSQAQEMKQILGRAAKFNSPSRDQDPKALMAGEAYHIVSKHLNSAVEKGGESLGKTDLIAELAAANREYGASKAMKKMLTNRYAREQGNKMGTGLTDSIFMAEAANIAAQGQPMKAAGLYGAKKAYEKYGNYGMAKGGDIIADILEKAPQSLGKYAPYMMNAARQGPQSLAVQHYVMSQRDPEYAAIVYGTKEE